MRIQPVTELPLVGGAEPSVASETVARDVGPEGQPETTLAYCGVCHDLYEVITGTGDRCPLCGYRIGDL